MKKREYAIDINKLPAMVEFVLNAFAACHAGKRTNNLVKVSCEEVLANVIAYADAQLIVIACDYNESDKLFILKIIDDGAEYNPLTVDLPDLDAELDERQIGGLGVYLYTMIMDKVTYMYQDGKNILTLYKKIPEEVI